jgi:hypothetical protein
MSLTIYVFSRDELSDVLEYICIQLRGIIVCDELSDVLDYLCIHLRGMLLCDEL